MPKPDYTEVRFIDIVREQHKWGIAERIIKYYERLYNIDIIHIYDELELLKSGYYLEDKTDPDIIMAYMYQTKEFSAVLPHVLGLEDSEKRDEFIKWLAVLSNYKYVMRCVHLCTREDIIHNMLIQHEAYREIRSREILETISEEPPRIRHSVLIMMTAISKFLSYHDEDDKIPFITEIDEKDSMMKWLIREFRDPSIGQEGMRDRVAKVLKQVEEYNSDHLNIKVKYSSKWFFKNKDQIDNFVMSIYTLQVKNGLLVKYD